MVFRAGQQKTGKS